LGFKFPRASDTVYPLGRTPQAGKLRSYSRGDHQHAINALWGTETIRVNQSILPIKTGSFDFGSDVYQWYEGYAYRWIASLSVRCPNIYASLFTPFLDEDCFLRTYNNINRSLNIQSYDTAVRTVATAIAGRIDIPRAGDITLLNGRYIDLGEVAALPTPSAFYHGKMIVIPRNPVTEEPSRAYVCLQSGALGQYEWILAATGSP